MEYATPAAILVLLFLPAKEEMVKLGLQNR
jgi:hypothetical protein